MRRFQLLPSQLDSEESGKNKRSIRFRHIDLRKTWRALAEFKENEVRCEKQQKINILTR